MLSTHGLRVCAILQDDLDVASQILDAAYGPSAARADRLRRYRSITDGRLQLIDDRGGRTSLLDASDAGAPLYRKMGFVEDDTMRLFDGEPLRNPTTKARAMVREDLTAAAALDGRVGAADRSTPTTRTARSWQCSTRRCRAHSTDR